MSIHTLTVDPASLFPRPRARSIREGRNTTLVDADHGMIVVDGDDLPMSGLPRGVLVSSARRGPTVLDLAFVI